jgi:hypothetical protein
MAPTVSCGFTEAGHRLNQMYLQQRRLLQHHNSPSTHSTFERLSGVQRTKRCENVLHERAQAFIRLEIGSAVTIKLLKPMPQPIYQ